MRKFLLFLLVLAGGVSTASAGTHTIKFVNGRGWTIVYAHFWDSNNSSTNTTEWPGVLMTKESTTTINGVQCDIYTLTTDDLSYTPNMIIFNNGSSGDGNQLADDTFTDNKTYGYSPTLYLHNNISGYSVNSDTYSSMGIWDGSQDVYQFNISGSDLGDNDFCFRLYRYGTSYEIEPYHESGKVGSDYTYAFANGKYETYDATNADNFQGTDKTYIISHSSIKASNYTISVYLQFPKNEAWKYYIKADIIDMPVTLSAEKGTFSCDRALNFEGTGIDAYMITGANDGLLTLSSAMTLVPANTGLYLEGTAGTVNVPVVETSQASEVSTSANMLVPGTNAAVSETSGANTNFILTNKTTTGDAPLRFYKANNNVVATNKAYLQIATSSVGAREFVWFDDDLAGVEKVSVDAEALKGQVFNLAGQRIVQPTKGLYIVNGKKVIMK